MKLENLKSAEKCQECGTITACLSEDGDAKRCCFCGNRLNGDYVFDNAVLSDPTMRAALEEAEAWCKAYEATPGEFLGYAMLSKLAEVRGRPLTWKEAIELTSLTTNMSDADKERLLALGDPGPRPAKVEIPSNATHISIEGCFFIVPPDHEADGTWFLWTNAGWVVTEATSEKPLFRMVREPVTPAPAEQKLAAAITALGLIADDDFEADHGATDQEISEQKGLAILRMQRTARKALIGAAQTGSTDVVQVPAELLDEDGLEAIQEWAATHDQTINVGEVELEGHDTHLESTAGYAVRLMKQLRALLATRQVEGGSKP